MTTPGLRCPHCGSENLRRSKRQTAGEFLAMLFGAYPFRCLQCGERFSGSVWMFSALFAAKCPRCLRTELLSWPEKFYRPTLWRRILFTLGAHRYRCEACRYNFISFRPRLGPGPQIDRQSMPNTPHVE